MNELYTIIAAFAVVALVDVVKIVSKWFDKATPTFPTWVKNLFPLLKLFAAIGVTVLVVWASKKFSVEFKNPLVVLILAQITHEVMGAMKKAREKNEDTPE